MASRSERQSFPRSGLGNSGIPDAVAVPVECDPASSARRQISTRPACMVKTMGNEAALTLPAHVGEVHWWAGWARRKPRMHPITKPHPHVPRRSYRP